MQQQLIASRCERCNGSGRVAGSGRSEQPWNSFQHTNPHVTLERILGMRPFQECPDCNGERVLRQVA